jgi:EAL domain-containing protein (putative c-di-GMP-specific phosphodiesterase class I)
MAQGYLIARPLPPGAVAGWLEAHGRDWRAGSDVSSAMR